ncbi:SapC family protein [Glaciecola sp. SC05]|uniref:SapC family protein n=1 Tax=Glaciecola sp. SC05 TaxID=1987355 RepID=UPI0035271A55
MAINYVPLDKDKHSDLKVNAAVNFAYASNTHLAAATIREFAQLSGSMPLVFIEDPNTKNVHTVAMLGLEQGSNLFFAEDKWQGPHVPLNIQRYPFDIRPDGDKLGVFIDENSDQLVAEGEALFTEAGEPTEYLKNRQQFLAELANSEVQNQRFIKLLQEHNLLEEIQVRINYRSKQSRNVTGILSINEKRLLDLDDDKILALHKSGYLGAAYAMMLSLGQLNRLVELSNKTDNPIQNLQISPVNQESAEAPTPA